jgi:fructokinase
VGLGEVLWDIFPSGPRPGGAPANFAYCSHLLGNRAIVASRVGDDEFGRKLCELFLRAGLTDQFIQIDSERPTGTVQVQVDDQGQPNFNIVQPSAWDFLECSAIWQSLAQSADAVCFGSLAQRSSQSREAILRFLERTRPDALRIFDVNLRQSFFSAATIEQSLAHADVLKLSHEELPLLKPLLQINTASGEDGEISFCRSLINKFDLRLVCITRGANGSFLCSPDGYHQHPGFHVQVRDAVGAGDAFTAGLAHELLRDGSLPEMNDLANRMGAWVASCEGAMPEVPEGGLKEALAKL